MRGDAAGPNLTFSHNGQYPGNDQSKQFELVSGLSPFDMGMDLGELILDGDLEFLNQMTLPFNTGTAPAP